MHVCTQVCVFAYMRVCIYVYASYKHYVYIHNDFSSVPDYSREVGGAVTLSVQYTIFIAVSQRTQL